MHLLHDADEPSENLAQKEIFEMLVKSPRIELNAVNEKGQTILHHVIKDRIEEYFELLLKEACHGRLDVNKKDDKGNSAVHYAFNFSYDYRRVRSYELVDPFTLKKFSPELEMILKYHKEASIDLETRDNNGRTPLHNLYLTRPKRRVEQFLKCAKDEYNIDFDVTARDQKGLLPADLSTRTR